MLIASIVGARPQFIKLAVMCRAFRCWPDVEHRIIHTGQHYDDAMSGTFFRDLAIPDPDFNLGVGSGTHAVQTADMLRQVEPVLLRERPDWVLLYGDTNSTAAGALAAAKLGVRVAHIEAGLRSFNRSMPEEINRIVADHLSDLLFCPTTAALENLAREGLGSRAVLTGDVMFDAVKIALNQVEKQNSPVRDWAKSPYAVATIHRAENTDDPERLSVIVAALDEIAAGICPVWFAVHPRTKAALEKRGLTFRHARCVPPLSYPDMLTAITQAQFVLTDSGGLQKEAYFVRTPCITLRNETEWVETLAHSCNALAGNTDAGRICAAARQASSAGPWTNHYGSGEAGIAIAQRLVGSGAGAVAVGCQCGIGGLSMVEPRPYGVLQRTADHLIVAGFSRVFGIVMFLLRHLKRGGESR